MPATSRAIVQTGPRAFEMRSLPLPEIGPDDALLRVEACGICGSDYEQYEGVLAGRYPVIPGHEPVGRIAEIGDRATERWGVRQGDRVCVEALAPCGRCPQCTSGSTHLCSGRGGIASYGFLSLDDPPGLWGAYADYLYLPPAVVVHRIDDSIDPVIATLFNPIGAGLRWAVAMPSLQPGETIVILGPGQRGLGSVLAAMEAGAGQIIVTGLERDAAKLDLAREFGADLALTADRDDIRRAVREATSGRGADVVIDVTSYATSAVTLAIDLARRGGRVVLAGTKGLTNPVPDFLSDKIVLKELTLLGALGVDHVNYERAVRLIESRKYPLEKMHTHTLPLDQAERAIRLLSGADPDEQAIHIALVP
ncbi:MAG TPA: zinc-binding dehydrogenase [Dehalococcoidia bacterium]|nr:zinc-binding dehydrogenase [Dehalococcoidia bacterium]